MSTDRRAILHLLAVGRLTPVEAERLLVAANDGNEGLLLVLAGIVFLGMTQGQAWAGRAFTALMPVIHHFTTSLTHNLSAVLGGSL